MKRIYDQLVWFDVNWNRPFARSFVWFNPA